MSGHPSAQVLGATFMFDSFISCAWMAVVVLLQDVSELHEFSVRLSDDIVPRRCFPFLV